MTKKRNQKAILTKCQDCGTNVKMYRNRLGPRCPECKIKRRSRLFTEAKQKQKESGICKYCQNPSIHFSIYCPYHYCFAVCKSSLGLKAKDVGELALELTRKLEAQNFLCYYTGLPLTIGVNSSLEHIIPRSVDAEKILDIDNLVWIRFEVNMMRRNMSFTDFTKFCKACAQSTTLDELAEAEIVHPHRVMV